MRWTICATVCAGCNDPALLALYGLVKSIGRPKGRFFLPALWTTSVTASSKNNFQIRRSGFRASTCGVCCAVLTAGRHIAHPAHRSQSSTTRASHGCEERPHNSRPPISCTTTPVHRAPPSHSLRSKCEVLFHSSSQQTSLGHERQCSSWRDCQPSRLAESERGRANELPLPRSSGFPRSQSNCKFAAPKPYTATRKYCREALPACPPSPTPGPHPPPNVVRHGSRGIRPMKRP